MKVLAAIGIFGALAVIVPACGAMLGYEETAGLMQPAAGWT